MEMGSRLDSPGSLHHVMGRGAEGNQIFDSPVECASFLAGIDRLAASMDFRIHAWAIMPNHYHLLVETGQDRLHSIMHRLLVRFSNSYNKRNSHRGHVFMSRFKSILVDRDAYLFELIRYIHLNPVRAGVLSNMAELASYPWTGHRALLHGNEHAWQSANEVLGFFSNSPGRGRTAYLNYLQDGLDGESRDDLEMGNFIIGKGGVVRESLSKVDQRRYDYTGAILGTRDFSVGVSIELSGRRRAVRNRRETHELIEVINDTVLGYFSLSPARIRGKSKGGKVSSARRVLCRLFSSSGICAADISRRLSITQAAVSVILGKPVEPAELLLEQQLRKQIRG